MSDPGPDDFLSGDAFESTAPAERPTIPGPAPEPTPREILAAIERVALSIAALNANFEMMRSTIHDHGTEIAKLKERVHRLEKAELARG